MWFLRMFVTGGVFAVVLVFAILNMPEWTNIRFLPGDGATYHVQLVFALFVAFVLGGFLWFVVSLVHDLRMRRQSAVLRREVERLSRELSTLRNLPLEDVLSDDTQIARPGT